MTTKHPSISPAKYSYYDTGVTKEKPVEYDDAVFYYFFTGAILLFFYFPVLFTAYVLTVANKKWRSKNKGYVFFLLCCGVACQIYYVYLMHMMVLIVNTFLGRV